MNPEKFTVFLRQRIRTENLALNERLSDTDISQHDTYDEANAARISNDERFGGWDATGTLHTRFHIRYPIGQ